MASSPGSSNAGHNSRSLPFCPWLQEGKSNKKTILLAPLIVLSFGALPKPHAASLLSGRFSRPWQSIVTGDRTRLLKGWAELQRKHMKQNKLFPILYSLIWDGKSCPFKWYLFTSEADCNKINKNSLIAYPALFCQACTFWN